LLYIELWPAIHLLYESIQAPEAQLLALVGVPTDTALVGEKLVQVAGERAAEGLGHQGTGRHTARSLLVATRA
jgi:hypothetical protein